MKVGSTHYRTIWLKPGDGRVVQIIDQRRLPHQFIIEDITSVAQMTAAVRDMHLRGAIVIGAAAACGAYLAAIEAAAVSDFSHTFSQLTEQLAAARPTAVNLRWGIEEVAAHIAQVEDPAKKVAAAKQKALDIIESEAERCRQIGEHGVCLLEEIAARKGGRPVQVLTHCNAGWLACVDFGTATAPLYEAQERGIPLHVWVDETRPRNQGARLTSWELGEQGVPHTVIVDNAGGHLMQHGMVDLVLVGTDRTAVSGDVGNKIGTYLKALAARDNDIPFYVALPSSSFDWKLRDGLSMPIEERDADEVRYVQGSLEGKVTRVRVTPADSPCANYAFDVTPARLVSGLITERGVCKASEESILSLYPEQAG